MLFMQTHPSFSLKKGFGFDAHPAIIRTSRRMARVIGSKSHALCNNPDSTGRSIVPRKDNSIYLRDSLPHVGLGMDASNAYVRRIP